MHIHTDAHMVIHTNACTHTHARLHTDTSGCTRRCTHTHKCMYTWIRTVMHVHTGAHVLRGAHTDVHTWLHTHMWQAAREGWVCMVHTLPRAGDTHMCHSMWEPLQKQPQCMGQRAWGDSLPHIPRGCGTAATCPYSPGGPWWCLPLSLSQQDGPVRFYIYLSNTFSIFLP